MSEWNTVAKFVSKLTSGTWVSVEASRTQLATPAGPLALPFASLLFASGQSQLLKM